MSNQEKKKTSPVRIVLTAVIITALLAAIAAVAAAASGQTLPEFIKTTAGLSERSAADELYYDTAGKAAFARVENGFIAASSAGVQVYSVSGDKTIDEYIPMYSPVVSSAGKYAAAYDSGEKNVLFFTRDKIISHIITDEPIISACVNDMGYLTVTSEETGYKGLVTVYDRTGAPVFKWHSGSGYAVKAVMNGRHELAVQTVAEGGSSVVFLSTDSSEEKGRWSFGGVIIDIAWIDGTLAALTDSNLTFIGKSGEEQAAWDHADRYIKAYAVSDSYFAIVTTEFLVDSVGILNVIDTDGTELAWADVDSGVISMDASGDTVALLYANSALIADSGLNEMYTFNELNASAIVARPGGDAFAAGAYSAKTLVPDRNSETTQETDK